MRQALFRVRDNEQDTGFLSYDDGYAFVEENPVVMLEDLADFCDSNAESRNNGTYVGTHRVLAALLHRETGREQATALLRAIAEYGGLDGMSGVGGQADAFADFGIKDCWEDWSLET